MKSEEVCSWWDVYILKEIIGLQSGDRIKPVTMLVKGEFANDLGQYDQLGCINQLYCFVPGHTQLGYL